MRIVLPLLLLAACGCPHRPTAPRPPPTPEQVVATTADVLRGHAAAAATVEVAARLADAPPEAIATACIIARAAPVLADTLDAAASGEGIPGAVLDLSDCGDLPPSVIAERVATGASEVGAIVGPVLAVLPPGCVRDRVEGWVEWGELASEAVGLAARGGAVRFALPSYVPEPCEVDSAADSAVSP